MVPAGKLCGNCIHQRAEEDDDGERVVCALGFLSKAQILNEPFWSRNLWGYYNAETEVVIEYYPIGEYDQDYDSWEVLPIRPEVCKRKSGRW